MTRFISPLPLGLYIHFPWCVRKCPYCDFNSHEMRSALDEKKYITALLHDLEQELPDIWGRQVTSIFMGGGTPSLFSPEAMDQLLCGIRARLQLTYDCEITLEANPGTVEQEKFNEYRQLGINRLSIGIQSFDEHKLQKLGRIHDRREAFRAAEAAHHAGFDNFNLDLMFGLPDQTLPEAISDINNAIALEPAHISHYQLTVEPNTLFYHHPPTVADDDTIYDMQLACQQQLALHDYQQYEVSAYARPGHRCRHNMNYWQFGDYLGIGAGAHAKLTFPTSDQVLRRWKLRHPADYLQHASTAQRIAGEQQLSDNDLVFEFMMNALRLCEGFETGLFQLHTGIAIERIMPLLDRAQASDWLEISTQKIKPTVSGLQYLNELLEVFLVDND